MPPRDLVALPRPDRRLRRWRHRPHRSSASKPASARGRSSAPAQKTRQWSPPQARQFQPLAADCCKGGIKGRTMKNIVLNLWPGAESLSWAEFCKTHPPYSVALDGYVRGKSRYDGQGPWLNLDHHEDIDRLSTRATCSHVWLR